MFYQMIRRAFTCGLRGMLCKLFFMFLKHTVMWLFEIKTCRWTWESRGVRAGPCSVYINLTYRGGEWEARCFKDDACGAKWANEELCTFFRRTTLFQRRRLHFYIYIYIYSPDHLKSRMFPDNKVENTSCTFFQRWDMADDGVTEAYWRGSGGSRQSAPVFYNLITPPPIFSLTLLHMCGTSNHWTRVEGKIEDSNSKDLSSTTMVFPCKD